MRLYWDDKRMWLSALTFAKIWNAIAVYLSFQISSIVKRPIHWGRPVHVSLEPTTACNLRCPECPSGLRAFTRDTGNISKDFFRPVIDELGRHAISVIFYFQGEPYIHPQFLEMVQHAKSKGLYTITSTNAHFLDDETARATIESGLDRLIISIDGTTQEVYEQYRKAGNLETVIQGARNVIKWKKQLKSRTPHVIFQFLVVRPNEHQIEDVHRLANEIGVDEVKLKTAQVYDYQNGHPLIPTDTKYARYIQNGNGKWQLKYKLRNRCWRMWQGCVVTWDGHVVPCCFDKDAVHKMGNLREQTISQIWNSPGYKAFRKQILTGRENIDICTNCTEGCTVFAE